MFSNFRKSLICIVAGVVFALASLVPATAQAGVTFIQSNQAHSVTGSTQNLTTGSITVTAHHSLIVWAVSLDGNVVPLQDTVGNTYVPAGFSTIFSGTFISAYFVQDALPGATAVTRSTNNTADLLGIYIAEYSGLANSGGLAGSFVFGTAATNGLGTDVLTSGASTVSTVPATVFAMTIDVGGMNNGVTANAGSFTAGTLQAWTGRTTGWADTSTPARMTSLAEDVGVVSAGSVTTTFGTTGNKQFSNSITAAFALPNAANGAALAGAASETSSAIGTLTAGTRSPFAPILLNNAAHTGSSDSLNLGTGPNTGTGDSLQVAAAKLIQWATDANTNFVALFPNRSLQAPTTGFSIAAATGITQLILNPAGTLAAGTVTFPNAPADEQPFQLMTSQAITSLTMNTSDGSAINGPLTTISANTSVTYRFVLSLNTWFRE